MTEPAIRPNESVVPLLPCTDAEATIAFWTALGFRITWNQTRPYLYLAFAWSGFELHYGRAAAGVDPAEESTGGCLVMVDAVAPYHAAFTAAMRGAHGKVLATGRPRITRFRPGASRFSIVDPSGNTIIVIRRDEPAELEYGGSAALTGIAKALDNARILREFKTDDRAAYRALQSAVRRHGDSGSAAELAEALAALIELGTALGEDVGGWGERLSGIPLGPAQVDALRATVADPALLDRWLV